MQQLKFPKTENITKILYNFLYKKNLIVLIGDRGIYLSAIYNNKTIDTLFILQGADLELKKYQSFLKKYNNYIVFFVLDNSLINLRHESVPVLPSMIKINPIEQFLSKHYSPEQIVAFNVYEVAPAGSEVWHTVISSYKMEPFLSSLLETALNYSLKLGGVYFLNLEFTYLINEILSQAGKKIDENEFQILVTITETSGIKFVVKHKKNILATKNLSYPKEKSELYIQGVIEQEVNDFLIFFKTYIVGAGLKVCIFLMAERQIEDFVKSCNFAEQTVISLTFDEINNRYKNLKFADMLLIELFAKNKKFLGINNELKYLLQLNIINLVVFKPLMLIALVLLLFLVKIEFSIFENQKKTITLNVKYYNLSEEYRNLKERYPTINNVTNLADLYSLESLIKIPVATPFEIVDKFLSSLNSRIHLLKIKWELIKPDPIIEFQPSIHFKANLNFYSSDEQEGNARNIAEINNYISLLKENFSGYEVTFKSNIEESVLALKKYIIPVEVHIKSLPRNI